MPSTSLTTGPDTFADDMILVDSDDRQVGVAPKMRAHVEGHRHRAISVIIVNSRGETLLQRRNPQ